MPEIPKTRNVSMASLPINQTPQQIALEGMKKSFVNFQGMSLGQKELQLKLGM